MLYAKKKQINPIRAVVRDRSADGDHKYFYTTTIGLSWVFLNFHDFSVSFACNLMIAVRQITNTEQYSKKAKKSLLITLKSIVLAGGLKYFFMLRLALILSCFKIIGVAGGWGGPLNRNASKDKYGRKKTIVSSVSVSCSIFAYNSTRVQQYLPIIILATRSPGPPQFNFVIQFKCITRVKLDFFF